MAAEIDPPTLKAWLSDGREIALFDVREHGQYGAGHLFFSVPLPYSRFEIDLPRLAPNAAVRVVLCDGGDGVAGRAAARAAALGYRNVSVLAGGAKAWGAAGYTLYAGVNVPSKVFGELVEQRRHTPRVSAQDVVAMRAAGEDFVIVDGRPFAEYRKMSIPGGICCPNGELVLRIRDIAPDSNTKIVVNCAGRTRSIIGAQTLIDFGVPNPVFALENGTQGWFLAGLELEHDAGRRYADAVGNGDLAALRSRAKRFAEACGAAFVAPAAAHAWLRDETRTTYLFDVRTAEEFAASGLPGFVHAPGGQLVQATDQWVGVKGARIVLLDREQVRAPVIAGWLRQLGHEAYALDDAVARARLAASGRLRAAGTAADRRARGGCRLARRHARRDRPARQHGLSQGPHGGGALGDEAGARGRAASRRDGCHRGRRAGIGGARRDRSRRRRGGRRSRDRGWISGVVRGRPADRGFAGSPRRFRLHRFSVFHPPPP